MKKRYYLYGLLVLVILFIAYNFYSANRAEENISELIQTEVNTSEQAISVQYSSFDVHPFRGNMQFEDITVIEPTTIKRTNSLTLDLSYFDFLKFNIGGTEYGLKHLSDALLILDSPTYVNRNTRAEVSFDSLYIHYSGNMWDAIQSYFTVQTPQLSHTIIINGTEGHYTKPQSAFRAFRVDSMDAHLTISNDFYTNEAEHSNTIRLRDITWTPPPAFQNKYAFFIQGFGFEMDSIPFTGAGFSYTIDEERIRITKGSIKMKLFTLNFRGIVETGPVARFSPLNVRVVKLSPQLKNVLQNVEQLLGTSIPIGSDRLRIQLVGPVADPRLISD